MPHEEPRRRGPRQLRCPAPRRTSSRPRLCLTSEAENADARHVGYVYVCHRIARSATQGTAGIASSAESGASRAKSNLERDVPGDGRRFSDLRRENKPWPPHPGRDGEEQHWLIIK